MKVEAVARGVSTRTLFPALAIAAWVSSVVLVLVGSIVRVTGHGLGCPDWPLCYGRAIPPAYTGAWVEFSHRLVGGVVSALVVALLILAVRDHREDKWVLRPVVAAAVLIPLQVLLGGLHVVLEIPPQTGLVHTGVAMLLVGVLAALVAASAIQVPAQASDFLRRGRLPTLITWTAATTFLLLLTGSHVTRSGASLACLSIPFCGSPVLGSYHPGTGQEQAVEPVSRVLREIHMLHRVVALILALMTAAIAVRLPVLPAAARLAGRLGRRTSLAQGEPSLSGFAYALGGLLALQILLGMANVLLLLPMWSRVLHLTLGATFWSVTVMLWAVSRTRQAPKDIRSIA